MNATFGKVLIFALLSLLSINARAVKTVDYFVVAHQDDWQLFMGLDAHMAMNNADSDSRVVFIHLTAGDATFGAPEVDKKYYKAREKGAIYSIQFSLDIRSLIARDYIDTVIVNNHPILRFGYKNVINYFLRLPDGCFGGGWKGQSLEYLHTGKISSIMAVDSSTVYNGWNDLTATLRSIMATESGTCSKISLNTAESNELLNPGDHPDHIQASLAIQEAAKEMNYVTRHLYIGYHLNDLAINVEPEDVALKAAIYGVAEFGRIQNSVSAAWNKNHIGYLCRRYERTIISKVDSALQGGTIPVKCSIYPNPARSYVNVAYKMDGPGSVNIVIRNIAGQAVLPAVNVSRAAGNYAERIDIGGLAIDNYYLTISGPGFNNTFILRKI